MDPLVVPSNFGNEITLLAPRLVTLSSLGKDAMLTEPLLSGFRFSTADDGPSGSALTSRLETEASGSDTPDVTPSSFGNVKAFTAITAVAAGFKLRGRCQLRLCRSLVCCLAI